MNAFKRWTHWFSWGCQFLPACCQVSLAAVRPPAAGCQHDLEPVSAESPSPQVLRAPANQHCQVSSTPANLEHLQTNSTVQHLQHQQAPKPVAIFNTCKLTTQSSLCNTCKPTRQCSVFYTRMLTLYSLFNTRRRNKHCRVSAALTVR